MEQVWSLLSDPRRVAACVPGAKITEQVDEKTYKGAISVKVGPEHHRTTKVNCRSSVSTRRTMKSKFSAKGRT